MRTFNNIFATLFAIIAVIGLIGVIFCGAIHQLPMCALSALMAVTLYNSDKTKQQQ
jgi:MFS superfamily sulfate permease-like transporter